MAYSESLKDTNLKYFKNNQRRIALNWLKDDYEKRIAPAIKRSGMPTSLQDDCREIILYGSCARGDFSSDSDVDVAILTDSDRETVKKYDSKIDDIATSIGIDTMAIVNFVCLPKKEFEEKNTWYPYFMNIKKEGIVLYEH